MVERRKTTDYDDFSYTEVLDAMRDRYRMAQNLDLHSVFCTADTKDTTGNDD